MALSWTMDKIGPICRTVEDCAMVFDAIYGKDARDPFSMESSFAYRSDMDAKTLKVGYLKSIFEEDYGFKQQDSLTLLTLQKAGIELVPIELPDAPALGFILSVEAAAAFDELTRSGRDDELIRQVRYAWPNVFRQARFVPAVEYVQANRLRSQLIQDFHEAIKEVDVYLSPSWHGPNLYQTNLTGHPCVVLPNGFIDGKPTSITFNGHLFGEEKVLALAKFYQELTDFHLKHPEGFE
jgi:Asp-tRNA(Asn)/Glu-tRNA(Gln) amidotransferase A subunit family amidase